MRPNKNILHHQLWRFLQNTIKIFLIECGRSFNGFLYFFGTFLLKEHKILIKQIYTYDFLDQTGSKMEFMVSNYMWRFRRSDAYLRNEWSNYTNWPYRNVLPQSLTDLITRQHWKYIRTRSISCKFKKYFDRYGNYYGWYLS